MERLCTYVCVRQSKSVCLIEKEKKKERKEREREIICTYVCVRERD